MNCPHTVTLPLGNVPAHGDGTTNARLCVACREVVPALVEEPAAPAPAPQQKTPKAPPAVLRRGDEPVKDSAPPYFGWPN